jgi:hypothetical protein
VLLVTLENMDSCIDPEDLGLPFDLITIADIPVFSQCPNSHIWEGDFEIVRCDNYEPVVVNLRVTCEFCEYKEALDQCVCINPAGCHKVEMKLDSAPTFQEGTHVDSKS